MFTRRNTTGFVYNQTGAVVNAPPSQQPLFTPIVDTDHSDFLRFAAVVVSVAILGFVSWKVLDTSVDNQNYARCDKVALCNTVVKAGLAKDGLIIAADGSMSVRAPVVQTISQPAPVVVVPAPQRPTVVYQQAAPPAQVVNPPVRTSCGTPSCFTGSAVTGGHASADGAGRCTMHGDGHEGVLGYEWPDRRCHENVFTGTRVAF